MKKKKLFAGLWSVRICGNCTETIIHLCISASQVDIYLATARLGKYPPLFTSTSVNNSYQVLMWLWHAEFVLEKAKSSDNGGPWITKSRNKFTCLWLLQTVCRFTNITVWKRYKTILQCACSFYYLHTLTRTPCYKNKIVSFISLISRIFVVFFLSGFLHRTVVMFSYNGV